jgi:protein O-mannosyl-transferase
MSLRVPGFLAGGLFLGTILVFQPAVRCDLVNLDDPTYVQSNPVLHEGLGAEGIRRAFTTVHAGYWIPLTWVSYQVDRELYGLAPGGYHRTNVLLHAGTAAMLFLVLLRMTGAVGRCFVTATLFALHPVQVESVAWVTERKDVLSTFVLVLTLWAYSRYVDRPGWRRYLLVLLFFVLGLMAKPMLVTLPVGLLLLDYWPLGRSGWKRLVAEKLPLLLLAVAAGVLTILTQRQGTAVRSLDELSLYSRLGNAVVSYVIYLRMLLWPYPLAVFYPHPEEALPFWQVLAAGITLVLLTVAAFALRRRAPYLLIGWLWYIITLGPVSGVLQAGWQGRADRFLYVPAIGLIAAAVWGLAALWERRPRTLAAAAVTVLAACAVGAVLQLRHWCDSLTLWEHSVAVTEDNFTARDSLAAALLDRGRVAEAIEHLHWARRLKPNHKLSHYLLGVAYRHQNRHDEAGQALLDALALSPDYVDAHALLAIVRVEQGRLPEAEGHARRALELAPDSAAAHEALGLVRLRQARTEEARDCFREAVRREPHSAAFRQRLDDLE